MLLRSRSRAEAPGPLVCVSRAWSAPADWAAAVGDSLPYAEAKASELAYAVSDLTRLRGRGERRLWVDKGCVPQSPLALRLAFIERIRDYISLADEMVVLRSWHYLGRLWCLFVWACFLAFKAPSQLHLAIEVFLTAQSAPLFAAAIRDLSVSARECAVAEDRAFVRQMIDACFSSISDVERFAKLTAIALLARATIRRAGRTGEDEHAARWIDHAAELGQPTLAAALRTADPTSSPQRQPLPVQVGSRGKFGGERLSLR
jgi:hypothetical protein